MPVLNKAVKNPRTVTLKEQLTGRWCSHCYILLRMTLGADNHTRVHRNHVPFIANLKYKTSKLSKTIKLSEVLLITTLWAKTRTTWDYFVLYSKMHILSIFHIGKNISSAAAANYLPLYHQFQFRLILDSDLTAS